MNFYHLNCPTTDPLYCYIENGMVPVPADRRYDPNSSPNPGGKWRWDNDAIGWHQVWFVNSDLLFFDKTKDSSFGTGIKLEKPFFAVFSTQLLMPGPAGHRVGGLKAVPEEFCLRTRYLGWTGV